MSVRNTVILTTSPRSAPKCPSVVRMFVKTCSVWASIPPSTTCIVTGSVPVSPAR